MGIADLFKDTCTIRRYTEGAQDGIGLPARTWADHIVDEACRLTTAKGPGGGRSVIIGAEVVIAPYTLFIGDIDVTERDTVTIDGIEYEILDVVSRADIDTDHHLELALRAVR